MTKTKTTQFLPGQLRVTLTVETAAERYGINQPGVRPSERFLIFDVTAPGLAQRDNVAGWVFADNPAGRNKARRLKNCIMAGLAFGGYSVLIDVGGQTYIAAKQRGFFHGKHFNRELTRLGF